MSLREYNRKRHFGVTPEPRGKKKLGREQRRALAFVVHKHQASRLHYDLRLEWRGELLSWAIPKGPSLNPSVKRLAMQVEAHPLDYASFEGTIPEGEYGGGTVMLWDQGTWMPEIENVRDALQAGDLKFALNGKKLKGSWVLVRTRALRGAESGNAWLLIKHRDHYASRAEVTRTMPYSVATRRLLASIARDEGGNVEKAAAGDPKKLMRSLQPKPRDRAAGR